MLPDVTDDPPTDVFCSKPFERLDANPPSEALGYGRATPTGSDGGNELLFLEINVGCGLERALAAVL